MIKKNSILVVMVLCLSSISVVSAAAPASSTSSYSSAYQHQPQAYGQSSSPQSSGSILSSIIPINSPINSPTSYQGSIGYSPTSYQGSVPGSSYQGTIPGSSGNSYSGIISPDIKTIEERIKHLRLARDQLNAQIAEFNMFILRRDEIERQIAEEQKKLSSFSYVAPQPQQISPLHQAPIGTSSYYVGQEIKK